MENDRSFSLDFLKIIATICIVFHHYQQVTGAVFENGINFWSGVFYWGYLVEFFFVLSGYFVYKYIDKIKKGLSFRRFYCMRAFRLLPLVAISALVYEVLLCIYTEIIGKNWFDITPTLWGIIITALGIQDGWCFSNPCVNNPTWYISVLLLCYILFWFVIFLSKKYNLNENILFIIIIFIGCGIVTYGINFPFLNQSSARGYYAFFTGVLLAEFLDKYKVTKQTLYSSMAIIVGLTFLIVVKNDYISKGIVFVMTFVYYPALVVVFESTLLKRFFRLKLWGELSKISFGVYIWHNPMFLLMYIICDVFGWNVDFGCVRNMLFFAFFSEALGIISYYFLEKKIAEKIKKKVIIN